MALQTSPKACQVCHTMINPVGFALENYDAVGRFRKEENGKPIDATGEYHSRSGETIPFTGPQDLAKYLGETEESHSAFTQQLFHYLVKQPINAFGPDELKTLTAAFEKQDFNIRRLMVEVMSASALTPRRASDKNQEAAPSVATTP